MLQLLLLLLSTFLTTVRSRREVAFENLVPRHQLQVALRTNRHPRFRLQDRLVWVWLQRLWPASRRDLLIVRPETVLRWHRKGWRLYWTWRSRARIGRPRLPAEVKDLIAQISRDNRLWGTERIRGELLKLGIVVSNRSIRRYRWRKPRPEGSQAWRTFLRNHLNGIWAADLFVVQTVGYRVLYVMFFISHSRRDMMHFNVTSNPTAAWVWRQLVEATPWGRQPSHLIHDGDAVYGRDFDAWTRAVGVIGVQTPRRAPNANSIAERVVRSIRVECLDHLIVINDRHLMAVLTEFIEYYNHDRPHRGLALASPVPGNPSRDGPVTSRAVLGGLHHAYGRRLNWTDYCRPTPDRRRLQGLEQRGAPTVGLGDPPLGVLGVVVAHAVPVASHSHAELALRRLAVLEGRTAGRAGRRGNSKPPAYPAPGSSSAPVRSWARSGLRRLLGYVFHPPRPRW